jgi:hypothetical protein
LDGDENKVANLAMWDTGDALTIICADYLGISVADKTVAILNFERSFRIYGVSGIEVECPVWIRPRSTLPNGAPGIDIILGQQVSPLNFPSSHESVPLSV